MYDVIIIGAGPAGLNAGLYCKRAGLNVLILDQYVAGGNLNNYLDIENVLGFGKIETADLLEKYFSHLNDFGVELHEFEEVLNVIATDKIKKVITTENEYECYSIILATGTTNRKLPIAKNGDDFIGNGVHYCAICDGALYKNKNVIVIGGGNSAVENALYLAELCKEVTIIQNLPELTADSIIKERILNYNNIKINCGLQIDSITKYNNTMLVECSLDGSKIGYPVDGVFINIGLEPNINLIQEPTEYNKNGIMTDVDMSVENYSGVYAIGDVRNTRLRQVSTAIADGSIAAMSCAKYVRELKESL